VDGDGIPYRTLPGTEHPLAAYFTRGSGHNESSGYTEKPQDYTNLLERINRKIESSKSMTPQPIETGDVDATVGVIAYGTSHWAVSESVDQLRAQGKKVRYMRIRALPSADKVRNSSSDTSMSTWVEQTCWARCRESCGPNWDRLRPR